MGDRDEELGIGDTSGLSDADWVEINKLRDAYRTGGQKALRDAWRKLTDDPIRTVRVYGAFFPDKLRNTIKDVMAAEGCDALQRALKLCLEQNPGRARQLDSMSMPAGTGFTAGSRVGSAAADTSRWHLEIAIQEQS